MKVQTRMYGNTMVRHYIIVHVHVHLHVLYMYMYNTIHTRSPDGSHKGIPWRSEYAYGDRSSTDAVDSAWRILKLGKATFYTCTISVRLKSNV